LNRRLKLTAIWTGGALAALLLPVVGLVAWLLFTNSGARWIAGTVTQRFAPQVKYGDLQGTIAGRLQVSDFRFEDGPKKAKIRIARMSVDPTLSMLFSRELRIERATVAGLVFTLPEQPEEKEDEPLWIEPPLEVSVRDFALEDARVFDGEKQLLHLKQLGIAAHWSREAIVVERLELLPGDIEGSLAARGRITPEGETVRAVLNARWRDVVIPAELAGRVLASEGEVDIDGTPERYAAKGKFDIGPPDDLAQVVIDVKGTDRQATIHALEVTQRAGRLSLAGSVEFKPRVAWDVSARADDFNPGAFAAQWPGRIDLDFATRGELAEQGPRGQVRIASLSGELRGRPLDGKGQLEFAAPSRLAGNLAVSSGKSRVSVRGDAGEAINAKVNLQVASLNDWAPNTRGSLTGQFRVRGAWPKLAIEGSAGGKSLALAGEPDANGRQENLAQARSVRVTANMKSPLDPEGSVDIDARNIEVSGFKFQGAQLKGSGNQSKHRVALQASGAPLVVTMEIAGGLGQGGWSGELQKLKLNARDVDLALRKPAQVKFGGGAFSLAESCFASDDSSLCVAANLAQDGSLQASYNFDRVQLALANALAPEAMHGQLRGEMRGAGKVRRAADGQWFGEAGVTSPSAQLVMRDDEPGESVLGQHTWLLYENLELRANLEGTRADARVSADLDHGGRIAGNLQVTQLTAAAPALRGEFEASLPSLAPFAAFVPTVANLNGQVDGKIQVGGTTAAPEFTGNAQATKLQADLGQLGIELREGEVTAEAARGGGFKLAGHVSSGKGKVDLQGTMSERGVVDARIRGENFLAADIPAANVVVTPDLALTGDPKGYLLKGEVTIPRADVNLQKLPKDEAPGVSPDVVVVRDGQVVQSVAKQSALPLTAAITVRLGDAINITGYGLDATVGGQLMVREAPGEPTTGSGQLTVSGKYKAYGQDLTVREGRLLFAGTPLDNPRLSMVAMREIDDDLSTGLRIAGSAKRPVITVVSSPEVGEADALSYLVTGRSLSDVGSASGSSQDALASATRSLEGAAGGLVAKRIGKRLGLDEAGVEENDMIGGSALTIGEYLSPRLYLSYGVGLFEPGEVIALRYKLSDDVGVKVERGTEETRTGVEYRIER
jgi:translocation and assembly module TamB